VSGAGGGAPTTDPTSDAGPGRRGPVGVGPAGGLTLAAPMESQNGHRPVPDPSSGVAVRSAPGGGEAGPASRFGPVTGAQFRRAAHGLVLVFVTVGAFFAFAIGSGIFGTVGQIVISLAFFGTALSWVWWVKLDLAQREHVVHEVREYVRRKPSHS
jgi:hypothetical protein